MGNHKVTEIHYMMTHLFILIYSHIVILWLLSHVCGVAGENIHSQIHV
jgi:hypothetical protein